MTKVSQLNLKYSIVIIKKGNKSNTFTNCTALLYFFAKPIIT
jgi:hypothetical protein